VNRISSPRFYQLASRLLPVFIFFVSSSVLALAQAPEPGKSPAGQPTETAQPAVENEQSEPQPDKSPVDAGKSAEALKRIERARALIAAHRLDTAAAELESIRATAKDNAFRNIASIMLMNVYLEEGNYGRAEALLEETFQARAAQKDESLGTYFALAGQAVNGTRTHLARYRSFGVSTADASLPEEAASDLNRLRSLLERMIAQAKEISNGRRVYDSLSLLEDVLGLRLSLAKDSDDQAKWESEYASARETLASSQTQIASLGGIPPLRSGRSQVSNPNAPSPYSTKKVPESPVSVKVIDKDHASGELQPRPGAPAGAPESETNGAAGGAANSGTDKPAVQGSQAKAGESAGETEDAGSLTPFATRKVVPRYPPVAKQTGTIGLVRVYLIVEGGKVVSVSRSEGPMMLRSAAEEAARQWSFQKVSIEGRPTRLNGYIDFNFSL
jgi:hypothetical protein